MFNPKKTIPKLAAAALALTGCGDDGGGAAGTGGSGGTGGTAGTGATAGMGGTGGTGGNSTFDAALEAFCMNVDTVCWGYTMQQCTLYYNVVNDYNTDPQCTAALISYFDCASSKNCTDIFAGACDAEYYAVWYTDGGACDEPF